MAELTIGVIGAGMMGAGIAQVCAVGGHQVRCVDRDPAALERATSEITSGRFGLDAAVSRGLLDRHAADEARRRIALGTELDAVSEADLVIEAIPEVLEQKIRLFRGLDQLCGPETILATNSSGLPVAAMAAATDRPERVLAWHWASPAPAMRFAEVVRTRNTSDATVELVVELAASLGKHPVVVADAPRSWGYVANRIYFAAADEARRVVAEGVATPEQVDQLLVDCYRWPVGPFAMIRNAEGEGW